MIEVVPWLARRSRRLGEGRGTPGHRKLADRQGWLPTAATKARSGGQPQHAVAGLDIYLCVGLPAIAILSEAVASGPSDFGGSPRVDGPGYQADDCRQANLLHRQRLPFQPDQRRYTSRRIFR